MHNPNTEPQPVWGAANIGKVIGRSRRQTFWLLQNDALPARRVGSRWVADRQALLRFINPDAEKPMAA